MKEIFGFFCHELKYVISKDIAKFFVIFDRYLIIDSDFTNVFIQLKSRFNSIEDDFRLGKIEGNVRTTEINKIRTSILDYLEEVREDQFKPQYKDWLIAHLRRKENIEYRAIAEMGEEISKEYKDIKISTKNIAIYIALFQFLIFIIFIFFADYRIGEIQKDPIPITKKNTYSFPENESPVKEVEDSIQVVIEFWTPSHLTKDYVSVMKDLDISIMEQDYKRYFVRDSTEQENKMFIDKIANDFNISGYSRYEVWGSGSKNEKPGWLWIVNIKNEEDYNRNTFLKIYKEHWGRKSGIYLVETFLTESAM